MHHLVEAPASGEVALITPSRAQRWTSHRRCWPSTRVRLMKTKAAAHAVDATRADLDEVNARHALGLDENRTRSLSDARLAGALPAKTWPTWWTRAVSNTAR